MELFQTLATELTTKREFATVNTTYLAAETFAPDLILMAIVRVEVGALFAKEPLTAQI